MDAARRPIEPEFLAQALAQGIRLRIGQMNRTELTGVIREVSRYEINVEENGAITTLLKKDIAQFSAPAPLLAPAAIHPAEENTASEGPSSRPNVQQEFLDKAVREHLTLSIFLVTGHRIRAAIEGYDNFTLLVKEGGAQHLLYKHAVTTINR